MSRVYFIRGGDQIKIGTSAKPEARLREMQTGNPMELVLLGTLVGGRSKEQALHSQFSHLRIRGEWFRVEEELMLEIDRLTGPLSEAQEATNSGLSGLPEEDDENYFAQLSMWCTAWAHFTNARDTGYIEESMIGPLVRAWFDEAYAAGCGGNFALRFLLQCGASLAGTQDAEQRAALIAVALADRGFCDNISDLAEKWAAWRP